MQAPIKNNLPTCSSSIIIRTCELDSGNYGSVHVAETAFGQLFAVKVMKRTRLATLTKAQTTKETAKFIGEATILSQLHHPNIVSFKFMVSDLPGGLPGMATEFVPHGSLSDAVKRRDQWLLSWDKVLGVASQIAGAMSYLHSKRVVHFDLKSANILVDLTTNNPICKLADFGLAMVQKHPSGLLAIGGQKGTLLYMAPEVVAAKFDVDKAAVTEKVDVYSFGILMWELLVGESPYRDLSREEIESNVYLRGARPEVPARCNAMWKTLMEQCWSFNAWARPSFEEISRRLHEMMMVERMLKLCRLLQARTLYREQSVCCCCQACMETGLICFCLLASALDLQRNEL